MWRRLVLQGNLLRLELATYILRLTFSALCFLPNLRMKQTDLQPCKRHPWPYYRVNCTLNRLIGACRLHHSLNLTLWGNKARRVVQ